MIAHVCRGRILSAIFAALLICGLAFGCKTTVERSGSAETGAYNVRSFGAKGDGTTIDTPAINKAIDTAASDGGGTVFFPAGTYACYTIRLKSNICLYLDQ